MFGKKKYQELISKINIIENKISILDNLKEQANYVQAGINNISDRDRNIEDRVIRLQDGIDITLGRIESKIQNLQESHDLTLGRIESQLSTTDHRVDEDGNLLKLALGRIEGKISSDNIEYKVFSQWGEDGIIQYLINNIDISNKTFIEFGVENYTESNTRFLLINNGWSGLVIDGSEENINYIKNDPIYWTYNLKTDCSFITAENINEIFVKNGISGKIGLLSIDIDGNDYWVWKNINVIDPDIVICEYNPRFGKEKAVTIPYRPDFLRHKAHYTGIYFGASIKALNNLAESKGYDIVYANEANLFFIKKELCNEIVKKRDVESLYRKNNYQDSRDKDGVLNRISYEEEQEIIWSLPLIEI